MDFPQYADLIKLLSNPVTFGILVSLIWEQTALFREDKLTPLAKMGIVVLSGLAWSLGVSMLRDGSIIGKDAWYAAIMAGVATAVSTQVFHKLVTTYLPGLAELLVQLRIGKVESTVTTSTANGASWSFTSKEAPDISPVTLMPLPPDAGAVG